MSDLDNTWQTRWLTLEGELIFRYHRLVIPTLRWHVRGKANVTLAKASGRPLLWAFWHEQVTAFIQYGDRFEGSDNFCVVMVGDDRASILGQMGGRLGAEMFGIDMSGNPVASGRSLLRVIQAMQRGKQSMLAPDGPDGPAHTPKGGVGFLARKAEAAVLPVGISTPHAYRMQRWDQHLVPLPFARMQMVIGPPIMPGRKDDDLTVLDQITAALNFVYRQAKAAA